MNSTLYCTISVDAPNDDTPPMLDATGTVVNPDGSIQNLAESGIQHTGIVSIPLKFRQSKQDLKDAIAAAFIAGYGLAVDLDVVLVPDF